jgi:hypothetical protein
MMNSPVGCAIRSHQASLLLVTGGFAASREQKEEAYRR